MTKTAIVGAVGSDARAIGEQAAVHMDGAFRAMMNGPGVSQNESFLRLVTGLPHPMGNMALVSEPDDLSSTHAAIEPLLGCGAPAAAVFPRGATPRVVDAVRSSGFTIDASMPAMAVDIARMTGTALPPGYEFVRVGAGEEGRAWAEALATGYEIPRPLADMFSPDVLGADMAPDARTQFFAVLREGRQVATSMLHLADGLAGIYCVSTRPEERRQGLGGIATAEALRVAQQVGYRVGVLQSSPSGHPVYLRLGFGDYARVPMYVRVPG
jgi:ribosomal protein S18 acetylase RimI-like enzyme